MSTEIEGFLLSPQQEALWMLSQERASAQSVIAISGELDVPTLLEAIKQVAGRHSALHTCFRRIPGMLVPIQVIDEHIVPVWSYHDLSNLTVKKQEQKREEIVYQDRSLPFDVEHGPLLRASLLTISPLKHALVLTLPALCADSQTLNILVKEIQLFYTSHSTLDDLEEATQYVQFSEWLKELQVEEGATCRSYWEHFQTARSSRVALPYEQTPSLTEGFEPTFIKSALPEKEVRLVAERYHVSPKSVLLACWYILLWRLSERPDMTIDVVFEGRTYEELQNVCGFFAKTLPLYASFTNKHSFVDVMTHLHSLLKEMAEKQDYYLDQPHADRQLEQGSVISFEFDEGYSSQPGTGPLFSLEQKYHWSHRFKANLQVLRCQEMLFLQFTYDPTIFTAVDIKCLSGQFHTLLTSALSAPEQAVGNLSLLGENERSYLLHELNSTTTDYPGEVCFHLLFEKTVEQSPEAVAVIAAERSMTYRELNARANQLAMTLQSAGVRPDTLVGISMDRSLEISIALLGILKAGGAFVPLDNSYSQHRLETIRQDAQLSLIITRKQTHVSFAPDSHIISLDADEPYDRAAGEKNPTSGVSQGNLAYVLYTSGSTGRPKGTMIPHRGLVNYVHWASQIYATSGTGAPFHTPIGFDLTITSLFVPFLVGKSVQILPEGLDLEELSRVFNTEQDFSFVKLTPAHLEALGHLQPSGKTALWADRLIIGGEALKEKHISFCRAYLPNTRLFNEYGPTETVVGCCVYEVPRASFQHGIVPIGRPIANTQMYILDSSFQPVAIGLPGEIYIGGDGLARGYLHRLDLTAECFVPNPFTSTPGARLYKTGDVARWRPEGIIEFLGRADSQVKIRGYRIELGEIEHQLREYSAVQDAVVLALDGSDGQKRLAAYLLCSEETLSERSNLDTFLQDRLPHYMLPSTFVSLQAWPLTSNGKIDYQALAQLKANQASSAITFTAPRNEAEKILAEACCELLHLERIGIHDNFFENGGDSILAIQLVARIRQSGLYLAPKKLFEYQTIAELAAVATTGMAVEAEQGEVTGPVPLTPIQHWFFEKQFRNPHHWNQSLLLEVQPSVAPLWLEEALQLLLSHHDALRLAFTSSEQVWSQFNAANVQSFELRLIDLADLPAAEQTQALQTMGTEFQQTFQLAESPLFRAILFSFGAQQPSRLLLIAHHLIIDGVSWRILLEDLHSAIAQLERGEKVHLPAKTTSYKYWAEKLVEYAQSGTLHHQLLSWLNTTSQTIAPIPLDYHQGVNTEASVQTMTVALTSEETRQLLQQVPGVYHSEINEVLLTALLQACRLWTGHHQLLITMEGHGREVFFEEIDLSRTVGWFTSLFPVLLETAEGATTLDTLKRVKATMRQIPQRGSGYGLLRYLTEDPVIRQAICTLPQAEISFNYLGQTDQVLEQSCFFAPAQEESGPNRDTSNLRETLLDVTAIVNAGKLHITWEYSEQIHSAETIEKLASSYLQALRELLTSASLPNVSVLADFLLAKLEQPILERLLQEQGNVEDIYPLSPAQDEMLRASLAALGSWAYFNQFSCTFQGNVNVVALQQACQQVVDRHAVLRTSFVWEKLSEPLQVVHLKRSLPFDVQDWQALTPEEQQARWTDYKEADRLRGFDLKTAPLVRLTLIRVTHDVYYFLWSHHHLLMDGWCMAPLLQEVFHSYQVLNHGQVNLIEPALPYRDYIAWLQQQDSTRSEQFWRQTLQGLQRPTLLASAPRSVLPATEQHYAEQSLLLPTEVTKSLHTFTRQYHITANTVVQGAWALTLSQFTGQDDLVFGATIADRPADISGVEARIGLFINTLPVRIQIAFPSLVTSWLQQIQEQQAALRQYTYSSLSHIHTWSNWAAGEPLFQSFIRFQNYPKDLTLEKQPDDFAIEEVSSIDRWHYPLCLIVNLAEECRLEISYQRDFFSDSMISQILAQFQQILTSMIEGAEESVAKLLDRCSLH